MRRFFRHIIPAIIVAFLVVGMTGCNKQRTPRPKFQIISLDKVSGSLNDGWQLHLTVANNTATKVTITDADATLYYKGRKVGFLDLNGEVVLPRRQCSKVVVPLRAKFSYAALPLLGKVRSGDLSGITVDYSFAISALTRHRIFEQQGVALDALAKQFNLGLKK